MAEEDEEGTEQEEAGWLKSLRKQAKDNSERDAELERYKAQERIRGAGLELNDRQLKALLATHEGEQTAEALKSTATELGFYKPPPEVDPEVRQGHETIQAATEGAITAPKTDAADEYAAANSPAEVMAIAAKRGSAVSYD